MPVFMVERYLPTLGPDGVDAQARRDDALGRRVGMRHVRTTYSREDELCFSVFEAASRDVVVVANDQADMAYERVSEVIEARALSAEEGS
jgi:hypothetical protein